MIFPLKVVPMKNDLLIAINRLEQFMLEKLGVE
jgi:hypothetical protein